MRRAVFSKGIGNNCRGGYLFQKEGPTDDSLGARAVTHTALECEHCVAGFQGDCERGLVAAINWSGCSIDVIKSFPLVAKRGCSGDHDLHFDRFVWGGPPHEGCGSVELGRSRRSRLAHGRWSSFRDGLWIGRSSGGWRGGLRGEGGRCGGNGMSGRGSDGHRGGRGGGGTGRKRLLRRGYPVHYRELCPDAKGGSLLD